ncbi:MAG: asparagine synthase-related protein [Faecalibacterium prausnitzii]
MRYVGAIDPVKKKLNSYGRGEVPAAQGLREGDWLPPEILWREKAAFSDAVGHSMVDDIKEYAESLYTDEEFRSSAGRNYSGPLHAVHQGEPVLPRNFREVLPRPEPHHRGLLDAQQGMAGLQRQRPSARVLANYGASGV